MGISGDSMETIRRFAEEHGISFPLVTDTGGKIKGLYSTQRINYLIDRSGVIRMIQRGVPKNALFLERIEALGLN